MLNTEPVINVAVDHSVALDVKEGDYYGIKVKYAKKAGEVENIDFASNVSSDNTVDFTVQGNNYVKEINNVEKASVAEYDTKGRKLSSLLDSSNIASLVNKAVSDASLVTSVNGKTGNVYIEKSDLELENVDNTSDMDKPVSTATQEALTALQSDYTSALSILQSEFTRQISTLTVAFDTLRAYYNNLEIRVTALENGSKADIDSNGQIVDQALLNRVAQLETKTENNTSNITSLSNEVSAVSSDVTALNSSVSAMATKTELNSNVTALSGSIATVSTSVQNLSDTLESDYYTSQDVDDAVSNAVSNAVTSVNSTTSASIASAVEGLASETYVDSALTSYATKTELSDAVADIPEFTVSTDEEGVTKAKLSNSDGDYIEIKNDD